MAPGGQVGIRGRKADARDPGWVLPAAWAGGWVVAQRADIVFQPERFRQPELRISCYESVVVQSTPWITTTVYGQLLLGALAGAACGDDGDAGEEHQGGAEGGAVVV